MRTLTIALLSTVLLLGPAFASDEVDAMKTVNQLIESFNSGDLKAALNSCAPQSVIIDEFPPFVWQGATGCADWLKDFDAFAKKNGITGAKVVLGRANIDVAEGRAYIVTPAHFTFRQRGKRMSEQGSIVTTLQNIENSWRVTGWAWAKR